MVVHLSDIMLQLILVDVRMQHETEYKEGRSSHAVCVWSAFVLAVEEMFPGLHFKIDQESFPKRRILYIRTGFSTSSRDDEEARILFCWPFSWEKKMEHVCLLPLESPQETVSLSEYQRLCPG